MSEDNDKPEGGAQLRRACRYLSVLAGHEVDGMRPGQIAEAMSVAPATITRDFKVLADEGFVERVPGMEDRWRLGPKPIQIFRAHELGLQRMQGRVDEVRQRYSREPK